jgi:valyl-tRNA synthetase
VLDAEGRKMSKSANNGVDPQDMIYKYGADALRMNMISGNSPGNDMRFFTERCESMRNFANKIWNASRFVMMNLTIEKNELPETLELEDKWILSKLNETVRAVTDGIDRYELGVAATKIYDFIWDSFCDWYIELTKPRLTGGDEGAKRGAQKVLLYALAEVLKLLHPFMPFITEEIWQALPDCGGAIMAQPYPAYSPSLTFPREGADFESVMAAIRAVRQRRAEMNVPPSKRPHLRVVTDKRDVFAAGRAYITKLAYAGELTVGGDAPESAEGYVVVVTGDARVFMPLAELVDLEKERARIEKELEKVKSDLARAEAQLRNERFTSKAPASVIQTERDKAAKARALIGNLEESLAPLAAAKESEK